MLLVPYEIETLEQERPWANWTIISVISLVSLGWIFGILTDSQVMPLVLHGWNPAGIFGHVLLHADFIHWLGNMIFLWVFGNAICTNIGNWRYIGVFAGCAVIAAMVQNVMDGTPAIGASGAINGITGMVLAMYPVNRVSMFWVFLIKGGTFQCRAWLVIGMWFLFDLLGVATGGGGIAYWAHLGGLAGGLLIGLVGLQTGWIRLTGCDNRSLLQLLKREREE